MRGQSRGHRAQLIGFDREGHVDLQGRIALDGHPPAGGAERPVGVERVGAVPGGAEREPGIVARQRVHRRPLRGDASGLDVAGGDGDPAGRDRDLRPGLDPVDRHPDALGQRLERGPEAGAHVLGPALVDRARAPTHPHHLEEQLGRVALREVGELLDQQRVERALQEQQRDRGDVADEAGAAPGGEERDATLLARGLEPVGHLGREGAPHVDELRAGAHDVLARRQEPTQLVDVEAARHVQDAVGLERDERVDVVGGRDTGVRTGPRELAGVDADLVGAEHAHAHDLEVRVRERRAQRPSTDVPRGPLHDAVPHQNPPRSAWYRIRTVRTGPGGTRQRGDRGVPRRAGPLARRAPHRARTALRRRGHPGRADGAAVSA